MTVIKNRLVKLERLNLIKKELHVKILRVIVDIKAPNPIGYKNDDFDFYLGPNECISELRKRCFSSAQGAIQRKIAEPIYKV